MENKKIDNKTYLKLWSLVSSASKEVVQFWLLNLLSWLFLLSAEKHHVWEEETVACWSQHSQQKYPSWATLCHSWSSTAQWSQGHILLGDSRPFQSQAVETRSIPALTGMNGHGMEQGSILHTNTCWLLCNPLPLVNYHSQRNVTLGHRIWPVAWSLSQLTWSWLGSVEHKGTGSTWQHIAHGWSLAWGLNSPSASNYWRWPKFIITTNKHYSLIPWLLGLNICMYIKVHMESLQTNFKVRDWSHTKLFSVMKLTRYHKNPETSTINCICLLLQCFREHNSVAGWGDCFLSSKAPKTNFFSCRH